MATPHRRGPWSTQEDIILMQLVKTHGPLNWVQISQTLNSRTPKQCRERYHQNLKPSLNHDPITPEEGAEIERLVQTHGKRWAEIARQLNGRSDNAVKNWWNGNQNRRKRLGRRRSEMSEDGHHPSQGVVSRHSLSPRGFMSTAASLSRPSLPLPPLNTSYSNGPGSSHTFAHHLDHMHGGDLPLPSPCSSESADSEYGSNYTTSPVRSSFSAAGQQVELPPLQALPQHHPVSSHKLPRISSLATPAPASFQQGFQQGPPSYASEPSPNQTLPPPLPHHRQPQLPAPTVLECRPGPPALGRERLPSRCNLPTAPNSPESHMLAKYHKEEMPRPSKDSRMNVATLLAPTERQDRH